MQGDVGAKYVKGSKKYVKHSLKEFTSFVKKHPKVFTVAAAKAAGGVAITGIGINLLKGNKNKSALNSQGK